MDMDEYTRTEGAPAGCYITEEGHLAPLPHYQTCQTCGETYKLKSSGGTSATFCSRACWRTLP